MGAASATAWVVAALLTQGCDASEPSDKLPASLRVRVSLENVASPFVTESGASVDLMIAPAMFAVVEDGAEPVAIGSTASAGLEQLAEDGDPTMLAAELNGAAGVLDVEVVNTAVDDYEVGAIVPGARFEVELTLRPQDRIWFAAMFVQSNDTFLAPTLPVAASVTLGGVVDNTSGDHAVQYWDAGTELDEAPGDGSYQAPRQSGPNTGPDQDGVVGPSTQQSDLPPTQDVVVFRVETIGVDGGE